MQLFKLIFFIRLMRENNVTIYVHRIGKFHIPSDLVVDQWASDGESRLHRDVMFLCDL
jgi:hypothetical protein